MSDRPQVPSHVLAAETPPRIFVIGEAMLEITHGAHDEVHLGYGGDTLNTCVYLARLGKAPHFVSALGVDPYSDRMLASWQEEGILIDGLLRHPSKLPGLYAVQTDEQGEREFYYWRDDSAARKLFALDGIEEVLHEASQSDYLYLSGITLSIFDHVEQQGLREVARAVKKRGGQVLFDPNYRPRGWADPQQAREVIMSFASTLSIVLPTLDDEHALHGRADTLTHALRWLSQGAETVVIKDGAHGAFIYGDDGSVSAVPVLEPIQAVDTTGAGDSFNAAYIAAHINGASPIECARAGHALAGEVVQHSGAIIPADSVRALHR